MEIPDQCEFTITKQDQAQLQTRTNGDTVIFGGIKLSQEQATILAWLVNSPKQLSVKVELTEDDLEE